MGSVQWDGVVDVLQPDTRPLTVSRAMRKPSSISTFHLERPLRLQDEPWCTKHPPLPCVVAGS